MKKVDMVHDPGRDDEPQVFKPEKKAGGWAFNRRDFLRLAVAATAGAVVASLPRVKDQLGRRVQLIAHATELPQPDLKPATSLTKVWYLKNNADQPWGEGATLSLIGGALWQAKSSVRLPNLAPGEVTLVRVSMIAPASLDSQPVEATIKLADDEFKIFLPIVHRAPPPPPCTCDGDIPCTCDSHIPCSCDTHICPCDYEVPCTCDVFVCPCDYEVPCVCDVHVCPCDYEAPCTCDTYVPCGCVYYVPCGCDGYVPCGCVYYF